ncbi:peptidoglycan DD-metalloendopeptidase family protein [Marinobacter fonticola]|uniref:peptidoglycan DD-metalloendopeptidase family protein n=1 Tax=Marinobacter fonticola TaxID=2603215 RepID=UPI0011E88B43|nr:peptidoglycan DD-metalloendopeptidase family protein [Marinobacter fonticola]
MSLFFNLSRNTRHVLVLAVVCVLTLMFFWRSDTSSAVSVPVETFPDDRLSGVNQEPIQLPVMAMPVAEEQKNAFAAAMEPQPTTEVYEIQPGDTLSEIFEVHGVAAKTLHQLLAADAEFLALETLQPGTLLTFTFDVNNQLQSVELELDPGRTVSYSRLDGGDFEHELVTEPMRWHTVLISGDIQGSFYASGLEAGLHKGQVAQVSQLLKNKLNFRRDLRAGDTFSVVVGEEMTATEATGNSRIEAIVLHRGARPYYAFLHSDGNYYDQSGESVTPAFLRYPTKHRYRISSSFDPYRLHPVTGRRAPHNGVDLATPPGTPIVSTGDGIVSRIGNHPYAGKYVEIEHSGAFKTRYLHLSRILVKRGQVIKRGKKIALSGATGRVTGPHLHFEFHVKRHPVNPLTAKIPTSAQVPESGMAAFKGRIRHQMAQLKVPSQMPAQFARGAGAIGEAASGPQQDWTTLCKRPGQCRYH